MRNILLTRPIAELLRAIGTKTTFVHGTRDAIAPLQRVRALADDTGADVIAVDSDHHGYADSARRQVLDAIAAAQ